MPTRDGKYRVLALDGGGVRGLLTLQVLEHIERVSGRRISELFDLICGTSTGGLIALGLAGPKLWSAAQLALIYGSDCKDIFRRSSSQKLKSFAQLAGPKYDNTALYRCAVEILGGSSKMSQAACPALVTTYDIAKRTPRFYSSWDTPDILQVDAAMSTTAAPTYFQPWNNNVDGGVCDNNPALTGVIELCRHSGCTVRDVVVCSVGTGSDMVSYDGKKAAGWGLLTWAEPLVSIFTDGTSELHAYHLKRLMPDDNLYRFQTGLTGSVALLDNVDEDNLCALVSAGQALIRRNYDLIESMTARLGA